MTNAIKNSRFTQARNESSAILKEHQMIEITGVSPYDLVAVECSCNRGESNEWVGKNSDDFSSHLVDQFTKVFRNERARELEDVRNTKSGRAISISLKNREKILLEGPEDFIQCEMCLGSGTHWGSKSEPRVTCTDCGGPGFTVEDEDE